MFHIDKMQDFAETIWGKIIIQETQNILEECILKLQKVKQDVARFTELDKYSLVLGQDIENLKHIYEHTGNWNTIYQNIHTLTWSKWPVDRKVTIDLKNEAKEIRDKIKKQVANIKIIYNSEEAIQDIQGMYEILKELQKIIQEFSKEFAEKKKEKNMIDFNDIEHFALKILIDSEKTEEKDDKIKIQNEETKQVQTKIKPSKVAQQYREKFKEIAIDEYQDSNLVQEYILNSISNGDNIFMVGDVKQSIYKFRQARPELFLEKYATYKLKEKRQEKNGLKIQLFKNFRSRENVLDITNLVFQDIMSQKLGDIEYEKEEYLNYGANYPDLPETEENTKIKTELNIIDLKENEEKDIYITEKIDKENDTEDIKKKLETNIEPTKNIEETNENENTDEEEKIENAVLEARFVAHRIKELLDSKQQVWDRKKESYRDITYKDICILLRATQTSAPIYEKELAELDLPVYSDTSGTYLEAMEVQIIMSLLKIIDNPMQDIPLATVLRSSIGNFTDNELIQIRLADKKGTFYEAMLKARLVVKKDLREKIENLLDNLETWRKQEEYLPLDELIWKIYIDTGFYHYVSLLNNGGLRQANLKLLFEKAKQYEKASFKGLFNFINFIDKVKTSSGDMGSAKLIGENENVIRIMSIHKSKGLEFPVVFLCGTGKKFNLQDLNKQILLHQDIGFGPKYIDVEKRIEYNTLAQEAIRIQTRRETISEEMRALYVALTRAKERLIITGLSKDLHKALQEKEALLNIYADNNETKNKINTSLVEKYVSYLDWLQLVYLNHKKQMENIMELKEHKKSEFLKTIIEQEEEETNIEDMLDKIEIENKQRLEQEVEQKLTWEYPFKQAQEIETKTSVTKLKQMEDENSIDIEDVLKPKEKPIKLTTVPKFREKQQKLTAMQKGTLMHLCIQKLDEKKEYTKEGIENFIQNLYDEGIISELEKEEVNRKVLYEYTTSDLWKELKQAKEIHKEQPFYISIPAKSIYKEAENTETILVQGIIDLYYINQKDELILIDFKTDYVKKGEKHKLEEKYKVQLDIYKQALEQALHRKVDKTKIYALS